jgi:hypothetical protein
MTTSFSVIPSDATYNQTLKWTTSPFSLKDILTVPESEVKQFRNIIGSLWLMGGVDQDLFGKFLYQGFNYMTLFRHIAKIRSKDPKNPVSDDAMKDIISKALAIHQLCGNVNERRYKGISPEGKQMVNEVNAFFGMKKNKRAAGPADFTYPRIGALFPFALSSIAHSHPLSFASRYDSSELPGFMRTSSFCSLIPSAWDYADLLISVYTCFSVDMTVAITARDYSKITVDELKIIVNTQKGYSTLSYNSGVVLNDERIRAFRWMRVDSQTNYEKIMHVARKFDPSSTLPDHGTWKLSLTKLYNGLRDVSNMPLAEIGGEAFEAPSAAPVPQPPAGPSTSSSSSPPALSGP